LIEQHLGPCVTLGTGAGFHLYQAKRPSAVTPARREREPRDPSRRY
jgi:hypothetical protein